MNERKNDGTQSRKNSFIESLTNVAIGYVIAFVSQLVIFPFYGGTFTLEQNIYIGAWFTFISVIRSYVIRRWFTKKTERYPYQPMSYFLQTSDQVFEERKKNELQASLLNENEASK
jgi:hypothetical protein